MLKQLLSETGEVSCMRVMSFLSLVFGFGIVVVGLIQGRDMSQLIGLVGIFVGSAFSGKLLSKPFETKDK